MAALLDLSHRLEQGPFDPLPAPKIRDWTTTLGNDGTAWLVYYAGNAQATNIHWARLQMLSWS